MIVDWRGVTIVLAVLAAVGVLCAIDLSCTSNRAPGVIERVQGELKSGRKEMAIKRRDEVAEQLRGLRALNRQLVREGELRRSRELTRLIVELEQQYRRLDAAARQ